MGPDSMSPKLLVLMLQLGRSMQVRAIETSNSLCRSPTENIDLSSVFDAVCMTNLKSEEELRSVIAP